MDGITWIALRRADRDDKIASTLAASRSFLVPAAIFRWPLFNAAASQVERLCKNEPKMSEESVASFPAAVPASLVASRRRIAARAPAYFRETCPGTCKHLTALSCTRFVNFVSVQ